MSDAEIEAEIAKAREAYVADLIAVVRKHSSYGGRGRLGMVYICDGLDALSKQIFDDFKKDYPLNPTPAATEQPKPKKKWWYFR